MVTWFGDDLRAGHCRIRPKVTENEIGEVARDWRVSGVARAEAPSPCRRSTGRKLWRDAGRTSRSFRRSPRSRRAA